METVKKPRKLPEQIADKLREMIIQEEMKTGSKLPAEAELMARFGARGGQDPADGAHRRYPPGAGHVPVRHAGPGR